MTIFDTKDYKKWVNFWVSKRPQGGRGQFTRIAEALNTSPTIVTQVFKGDRDLTADQAVLLADFMGLSKSERQFFILLINYSRAASHRYKKILEEEIEELRLRSNEIKTRVQQTHELTSEAKAILYSNWYYLAIWSLTAISKFNTVDTISEKLNLSRRKIIDALEFLKKYSLVIEKNGNLQVGPTLIHLESESPQIARHHQNWRLQAFRKYEVSSANDAFYTAPVTLSKVDALVVRQKVLQFISDTVSIIKDSPSEELYCLCIDWFEI